MHILISYLFVLVFVCFPAMAQDNVIRIIGEDGSVQEVVIEAPEPVVEPIVESIVPSAEPEVLEKIEAVEETPQALPEEAPVKDVSETLSPMPEKVETEIVQEVVPVEDKVEQKESVAPEAVEVVQEEKKTEPEQEPVMIVPVPPRKPALPPAAGMGHRNPQMLDDMQEQAGISREQAIALALEHAPPARTIRAWPRVYNDRPVYEVIFKTEQGDHVIYIDQADGHVINP